VTNPSRPMSLMHSRIARKIYIYRILCLYSWFLCTSNLSKLKSSSYKHRTKSRTFENIVKFENIENITWFIKISVTVKTKLPLNALLFTVFDVKLKRGQYVFWLFFKIDLSSATSIIRLNTDLSWKISKNTFSPPFSFTPKTGIAFPYTGILFLLRVERTFRFHL